MTLELNIAAAQLDGYRVETLDNRLFFLVREGWRRGPYTSARDAWRFGGIPDYSGSKIEALQLAQRIGVEIDATQPTPEIVQAIIDSVRVIEDAPEFETTATTPVDVDEVNPPKRKRSSKSKVGDNDQP